MEFGPGWNLVAGACALALLQVTSSTTRTVHPLTRFLLGPQIPRFALWTCFLLLLITLVFACDSPITSDACLEAMASTSESKTAATATTAAGTTATPAPGAAVQRAIKQVLTSKKSVEGGT
jgi:hypothetical protein